MTDAILLIDAYFDEVIDDAQMAALEQYIIHEPKIAELFTARSTLHRQIIDHAAASAYSGPVIEAEVGSDFSARSLSMPRWGYFAAAAAAILLVVSAAVVLTPAKPAERTTSQPKASAAAIAVLTDTGNAVFADSTAPIRLGGALPAGTIRLVSGTAQIMFDSTAAVELVGPCDFELVDHNSARLHRGLVYADVPGRATGFAVHTPGGLSIVDLGTRFSVEITETGTRVDTLEGAVQLRRGNQTLTTVTAGQAVMYRDEALTALPAARGPLERRVHFGFAPGDAMGWRLHRGGALVEPDDQSFGDGGSPNLLAIDGKVTYADGRPPMPPAAGDGLLGSMPFERRDEHHPTLVMRSPAFVLEPGGAIELKLLGGSGGAESPPQRDSDLSVESKPEGFMGVALRRERDGRYLAALRRTEPGEDKAGWQTLRWDAEMLVALGADREVLTLDLIDAYEGDWGWIALDEVIIDGGLAEAQAP